MSEVMKAFLVLMHQARFDARGAHEYSFDRTEKGQNEDKCAALAYACSCVARVSAAQALYWCKLEELEHQELPALFAQFNVFAEEVKKDFATNHSRQWVDIEFRKLEDLFDESVCNQPIVD